MLVCENIQPSLDTPHNYIPAELIEKSALKGLTGRLANKDLLITKK